MGPSLAPAAASSSSSPTSNPTPSAHYVPPSTILIIGSGVFGLSTAHALARRPAFAHAKLTVVDRSNKPGVFPSRDASSIDTSRIVRADYADPAYAALSAEAQVFWRRRGDTELGGQGRYTESGLVLVADEPSAAPNAEKKKTGMDYVRESWENVVALTKTDPALGDHVRVLPDPAAIRDAVGTGGASGSWGYLNGGSGWADADASMRWLYEQVVATGRVEFVNGTVASLNTTAVPADRGVVTGATLDDGRVLSADLVILATGAWTGSLLDLSGRATATGQVLGYMDITQEEQDQLGRMPVLLNLTTGLFIVPPAGGLLKVARHAYGYNNPASIPDATTTTTPPPPSSSTLPLLGPGTGPVSRPLTHIDRPDLSIPAEGEAALRACLREMVPLPSIHDRPFTRTRLCWYTDTPDGNFIIDYHPRWKGLFVATGGSGHGFKFLPVIGEKITDVVAGHPPPEFRDKWSWKDLAESGGGPIVTEDGSRGGQPGLVLQDELDKTKR